MYSRQNPTNGFLGNKNMVFISSLAKPRPTESCNPFKPDTSAYGNTWKWTQGNALHKHNKCQ